MRFSKKLVFLQYWFAKVEKFSLRPNTSFVTSFVQAEAENGLLGAASKSSQRSVRDLNLGGVLAREADKSLLVSPPKFAVKLASRSYEPIKGPSCPLRGQGKYNVITKPETSRFSALQLDTTYSIKAGNTPFLLESLGAPKPWYSYWLLPLIGFVVVFDTCTLKQVIEVSTRTLSDRFRNNGLTTLGYTPAFEEPFENSGQLARFATSFDNSTAVDATTLSRSGDGGTVKHSLRASYGFNFLEPNHGKYSSLTDRSVHSTSSFFGVPMSKIDPLSIKERTSKQQFNKHQKAAYLQATSFQYRKLNSFLTSWENPSTSKLPHSRKQLSEVNLSIYQSRSSNLDPSQQVKNYSAICDVIVKKSVFSHDNSYTKAILEHLNELPQLTASQQVLENNKQSKLYARSASTVKQQNIYAFFAEYFQEAPNSPRLGNSQDRTSFSFDHLSKINLRFSQNYNDLVYLYNFLLDKTFSSNGRKVSIEDRYFSAAQSTADYSVIVLKNDFLATAYKRTLLSASRTSKHLKKENNSESLPVKGEALVPVWTSNIFSFDKKLTSLPTVKEISPSPSSSSFALNYQSKFQKYLEFVYKNLLIKYDKFNSIVIKTRTEMKINHQFNLKNRKLNDYEYPILYKSLKLNTHSAFDVYTRESLSASRTRRSFSPVSGVRASFSKTGSLRGDKVFNTGVGRTTDSKVAVMSEGPNNDRFAAKLASPEKYLHKNLSQVPSETSISRRRMEVASKFLLSKFKERSIAQCFKKSVLIQSRRKAFDQVTPKDLLRIKQFIFLNNLEKQELKLYQNLNIVLKEEKLLYEALQRQTIKQKRRKKKRKRWTRRRRKRKRKLLRPLWITLRLVSMLNTSRLNQNLKSGHPVSSGLLQSKKIKVTLQSISGSANDRLHPLLATKSIFKLSKKPLVALSNLKKYKAHCKQLLKNYEMLTRTKTNVSTVLKVQNILFKQLNLANNFLLRSANNKSATVAVDTARSFDDGTGKRTSESLAPYRVNKSALDQLDTNRITLNKVLEYNRIMYEKMQSTLLMNASTAQVQRKDQINSNLQLKHTKSLVQEPKEEWLWLFRYISGEISSSPKLTSSDELRSFWAMRKLNSINQWTGWKNFYNKDLKKGLTSVYELWQDKKPDRRLKVNTLRKRQYKQIKDVQRLRLYAKFKRGSYYAMRRNLAKLETLGIILPKKAFVEKLQRIPIELVNRRVTTASERTNQSTFINPNEHLRFTLKQLKLSNFILKTTSLERPEKSFYLPHEQSKPIMDLYSTWWDKSNTSWDWKTIQYGPRWDRKTLYLPTQLTNGPLFSSRKIPISSTLSQFTLNQQILNDSVVNHNKDLVKNNYSKTTDVMKTLVLTTLLLHLCAFLILASIPEIRYLIKVQIVLFYKLSAIPYNLIISVVEPLFSPSSNEQRQTKIPPTITSSQDPLVRETAKTAQSKGLTGQTGDGYLIGPTLKDKRSERVTAQAAKALAFQSLKNPTFIFPAKQSFAESPISFFAILKQFIQRSLRIQLSAKKTSSESSYPLDLSLNKSTHVRSLRSEAFASLVHVSTLKTKSIPLQTSLIRYQLLQSTTNLSVRSYYKLLKLGEVFIDCTREAVRSFYDFISLPENYSPNPDEFSLDILANFIYDFEEPLVELMPDLIETQFEKYLNRYLVTLSLFGPLGMLVQQRLNWFYRISVELIYAADADYLKDDQELHLLYTIWSDILIKAASELDLEASIIATKEDQRSLVLDYLITSNLLSRGLRKDERSERFAVQTGKDPLVRKTDKDERSGGFTMPRVASAHPLRNTYTVSAEQTGLQLVTNNWFQARLDSTDFKLDFHGSPSEANGLNRKVISWFADQYILYKTDETDLFLEINTPKTFAHIRSLKYWDTIHQPLGNTLCQAYSGLFAKQISKNILILGEPTSDKSLLIQALAGEAELKLILDNCSRYASVTQSVAVGMRMLREVFESVALQTPCIFMLEDIHLIGEKRPFLISDEDFALVTNSGLGLEQYHLYEKNQTIQKQSKHQLSYFKKAFRGEKADSLPTNLFCYDLFLNQLPSSKFKANTYPLNLDFHGELDSSLTLFSDRANMQEPELLRSGYTHLTLKNQAMLDLGTTKTNLTPKINHSVPESPWLSQTEDLEVDVIKSPLSSIRAKVSTLANHSLANMSVKVDRITQLLVIMDNIRKNKGFIVFATTHKPQILDPALRRPGRLEETIIIPAIPHLLSKWEVLRTNSTPLLSSQSPTKLTFDLIQSFVVNDQLAFYSQPREKNTQIQATQLFYQLSTNALLAQTYNTTGPASLVKQLNITIHDSCTSTQLQKQLQSNDKQSERFAAQASTVSSFNKLKSLSSSRNTKINGLALDLKLRSYELLGKVLIQLMFEQTSSTVVLAMGKLPVKKYSTIQEQIFTKLYTTKTIFAKELLSLFAGTVSTFMVGKHASSLFTQQHSAFSSSPAVQQSGRIALSSALISKSLDTTQDQDWQVATKLIYSFVQKRTIYNKNASLHRLLNVNKGSVYGFANPPTTRLLLPTKRFENYLRTEKEYEQTSLLASTIGIQEKIQLHLAQRVLKRLYRLPIKEYYKSELIENSLTTFSSSTITLPQDTANFATHNKQSKTNFYYRNLYLKRHRNYLTTQWWTGHLTEYNIENTVISEIDFRSCFIGKNRTSLSELILDFPDAEQYYSPKQRRWFVHSNTWKTWSDLEKGLSTDIIFHFIFESFVRVYKLLTKNRELLDLLVSKNIRKGKLLEYELLQIISTF